jgi:ribosomal protein L37AE/L43A
MFAEGKAAILLLMHGNPAENWQRLTEHYREIGDGELLELAADFVDLTETAQQVLRNEMRNRGLDESRAAGETRTNSDRPAHPRWTGSVDPDAGANEFSAPGANGEDDLPREFTWKTTLCECDDREQAWQIYEVLRQAGIESWIEGPGARRSTGNPRVAVAADQLEEAREIAARPIPQEIVDLSRLEEPEFEPPKCPKCGAEDPVLESVEPANAWLCEACGKQWTESPPDPDGKLEEAER